MVGRWTVRMDRGTDVRWTEGLVRWTDGLVKYRDGRKRDRWIGKIERRQVKWTEGLVR